MSPLARTTEIDYDTRAANEDCINGGSRTRTKYAYDANGNMTNRASATQNVYWLSSNYPSSDYSKRRDRLVKPSLSTTDPIASWWGRTTMARVATR